MQEIATQPINEVQKIDLNKQEKVNAIFHSVAKKYDLMNNIMSFGMHHLWKDKFITRLKPAKYSKWHQLDVAGGTGDISFKALKASKNNLDAHITLLDINSSMLEVGKNRAIEQHLEHQIDFIEGDAQNLPFNDNSFDAYTIAFGIRNVPNISLAIQEAYRVLKPGGHFLCLEFSHVTDSMFEKLYDAWSFYAIPNIGKFVANDKAAYQYLVESIRSFPEQDNFLTMIKEQGFKRCGYINLSMGIAAIHEGWKL